MLHVNYVSIKKEYVGKKEQKQENKKKGKKRKKNGMYLLKFPTKVYWDAPFSYYFCNSIISIT